MFAIDGGIVRPTIHKTLIFLDYLQMKYLLFSVTNHWKNFKNCFYILIRKYGSHRSSSGRVHEPSFEWPWNRGKTTSTTRLPLQISSFKKETRLLWMKNGF